MNVKYKEVCELIKKTNPELEIENLSYNIEGALISDYKFYINNTTYIYTDGVNTHIKKTDLGFLMNLYDNDNTKYITKTIANKLYLIREFIGDELLVSVFDNETGKEVKDNSMNMRKVYENTKGKYILINNKRCYVEL